MPDHTRAKMAPTDYPVIVAGGITVQAVTATNPDGTEVPAIVLRVGGTDNETGEATGTSVVLAARAVGGLTGQMIRHANDAVTSTDQEERP